MAEVIVEAYQDFEHELREQTGILIELKVGELVGNEPENRPWDDWRIHTHD